MICPGCGKCAQNLTSMGLCLAMLSRQPCGSHQNNSLLSSGNTTLRSAGVSGNFTLLAGRAFGCGDVPSFGNTM
uniref:(California timema) hypothetical protein n=1 Tax=Timema californicum TaxID=61474 RepID=A0A7R9J8R1_TIMCA|nr:unnamed protein product [Timema californicum]